MMHVKQVGIADLDNLMTCIVTMLAAILADDEACGCSAELHL